MPSEPVKYADLVADWLEDLGYTHCFFVAGGNIMHLLDACRTRFECIATVHEVAAGIATEYFNALDHDRGKAFALVTAGPGLTNIVTAFGGAYLESREMLVLGGQVKSTDLAGPELRQRGIQEIDGIACVRDMCVASMRIERPEPRSVVEPLVVRGSTPRRGPVFLEMCLDAQGAPVHREDLEGEDTAPAPAPVTATGDEIADVVARIGAAERPVFLIGGGVSRAGAAAAIEDLRRLRIPVLTTWNGLDRISSEEEVYAGRPNTWGQRSANLILQQADLVLALGTRLGLQQTGFNWQEFVPVGDVVQVDLDPTELAKGHPEIALGLAVDADDLLLRVAQAAEPADGEWLAFAREVRELVPLNDPENCTGEGYVDPFDFVLRLSALAGDDDVFVPASSGGANSVSMQAWQQRGRQQVVADKGSAAMGYGLSGAIGAALASRRRTILIEGDGGFAQNVQELGTVAVNDLDLKIVLWDNDGYGSIRTTQRNYFGGAYLGCDTNTGLGFPDWELLFQAFGIPFVRVDVGWESDARFHELWERRGPAGFVVPIDPEQTYWPKISSRVTATGSMESNPLHRMSPDLPPEVAERVYRWVEAPI